MSTNNEEILIRLGLNSDAMKKGIDEATKSAKHSLSEGLSDVGMDLLKGFTAGAIMAKMEGVFEKVKQLQSAAAKTGIDVTDYQRLSTIANEEMPDGASKFEQAITKLNVNIGKGGKEFEKWGIHARNAEDAMYEIADKMHETENPAERAAMAVELMGRSGVSLVPLLERGSAALKQMKDSKLGWTKEEIEGITNARLALEEAQNRITYGFGWMIAKFVDAAKFWGASSVGMHWADLSSDGLDANMIAENMQKIQEKITKEKRKQAESMETEQQKETLGKLQEENDKLHEKSKTLKELKDSIKSQEDVVKSLGVATFQFQDGSREKAEALIKLAEHQNKLEQTKLDLKKQQAEHDKRVEKVNSEQSKYDTAKDALGRSRPTIEMLAGRDAKKRLEQTFGEGGEMDIESGGGPFAQAAEDAEYYRKKQIYDLENPAVLNEKQLRRNKRAKPIYENPIEDIQNADGTMSTRLRKGTAAYEDQQMVIQNENKLKQAGIETPDMRMKAIEDGILKSNEFLKSTHDLLNSGKVIFQIKAS